MSKQSDEDDEYLALVERQRARALATIERVKALVDDWPPNYDDDDRTHSDDCHKWHADCLMLGIRAAIEGAS